MCAQGISWMGLRVVGHLCSSYAYSDVNIAVMYLFVNGFVWIRQAVVLPMNLLNIIS
jgi:hypothetical protein